MLLTHSLSKNFCFLCSLVLIHLTQSSAHLNLTEAYVSLEVFLTQGLWVCGWWENERTFSEEGGPGGAREQVIKPGGLEKIGKDHKQTGLGNLQWQQ